MISDMATNSSRGETFTATLERDQVRGYGFSLRGGAEHGLGHFVSSVDQGSVADSQGLKAGDQILRIDGLPLATATHKEAVAFISSRKKLAVEIKRAGVLPVKKALGDPVQWLKCGRNEAKKLLQQANLLATERVLIDLGEDYGKLGLGCSICKGPPDHPGIFVQSIKPNGAAFRAGLHLGDQILRCNNMSFEGPALDFTLAVAQVRAHKCLDLMIRRGAGLDVVMEDEAERILQDEKRLLQSQFLLERRKLEAEQERLKLEAARIDQEKEKLELEKQRLQKTTSCSDESTTSSTGHDNSSLESSSSGGLVNAIQSELKRRRAASAEATASLKPTLKPQGSNEAASAGVSSKKPVKAIMHNEKHDQLMAEFRKVHKKMFTNSSTETEEEEDRPEEECKGPNEGIAAKAIDNFDRSSDETLVKPAKVAPPAPPQRSSSISPISSPQPLLTFSKPMSPLPDCEEDISPGIPTPDYDTGSSPEPLNENTGGLGKPAISSSSSSRSNRSSDSISSGSTGALRIRKPVDPRVKTFSKRHPHIEVGSLDSFSIEDKNDFLSKYPPPFYFDMTTRPGGFSENDVEEAATTVITDEEDKKCHSPTKNVRFNVSSSEAAIAAHDYRVAHATRRAIRYTSELHKTLAVRSGVRSKMHQSSSVSSSGVSSSSPRNLSSSSEEEELEQFRPKTRPRSPKKYPAPPPPPPPPPKGTIYATPALPPKTMPKGIN